MNRVASIIAPLTLGLSLAEGVQAQTTTDAHSNHEIAAYSDQVRMQARKTIQPLGLRLEGVNTTVSNHSHVGYRLGESGWSVGINHSRIKGQALSPGMKQGGVNLGVAYILSTDIF